MRKSTVRTTDPIVVQYAAAVRQRLGARVKSITLYGSRARGDAKPGSDYDMLLVLTERTPAVRAAVLEIEGEILDQHGELVASLIRDEQEWQNAQGFPLARNVAREGVAVLTRLYEDRQAGDYDASASVGIADASQDVADAERVVTAVLSHLATA